MFSGLPEKFGVFSIHYETTIVPKKYRIGNAEEIDSYAYFYPPNIYGIQFHPELMGNLGTILIKLQKILFDRLVYQDFSVKTRKEFGQRIFKNFIYNK